MRTTLRRGDDFPTQQNGGPQKGMLIAVPLFHVTGCTSFAVSPIVLCCLLILNSVSDDVHHDRHENSLDKEMGD